MSAPFPPGFLSVGGKDAPKPLEGSCASDDHQDPLDRLRALANLMPGYAVRVAVTLRIPDLIEAGVTDTTDIARLTATTESGLRALLYYLAGLGVLDKAGRDRFALTDMSRLLCTSHPDSRVDEYDVEQGRGRADVFFGLLESIRSGQPAYPAVHGLTFWEDLAANPGLGKKWAAMFAQHAEPIGRDLARAYDWSEWGDVADVGGGTGVMLAELLEANPHLNGVLVDLEGVAALARDLLASRGLAARARVWAGSFFEPLPTAHVYVLSWILHDWGDDEATRILANCAAAAGPAGRILIVEQPFEADSVTRGVASMHLRMLVLFGGQERSRDDFDRLGHQVGLVRVGEYPLSSGFVAFEYRVQSRPR